ncbi:hypothetical protein THAOC_22663 [Thalassiosira oceanica]|uniref:Uncharacterized protein n=1 Tax=Thalassiosira oceanica TaxID=159749 RepID=K0RTZ1_THAOC|nr:hypothetical protein THAOC_22663 [Thalassiosira oceanica]|eukprot:EJK57308.1 hypothetical protein THAOC_22663 [Thalassiosira oceanica]
MERPANSIWLDFKERRLTEKLRRTLLPTQTEMHTNAVQRWTTAAKCARSCLTSIRRDVRTRKASSHRLVAAHESGGRSLAAPTSSRGFSGDSGHDDAYTPEQRREDHRHCVELVQTRDSEGYCEFQ